MLLAAALLFASGLAAAQPTPPAPPPAAGDDLAGRIAAAADPETRYRLALQALAAGDARLARDALEQVVAAQPRFAGAWLDLALATARSGDLAAAVEHLEYLRSQFDLPPALQAVVATWLASWQAPAAASPHPPQADPGRWQGELFVALGHDSNPNAGIASREIPLTTAGGTGFFLVAPDFRPQPSPVWHTALALAAPRAATPLGALSPFLLVRARQLPQAPRYDTLDLQAGVTLDPAGAVSPWQHSLVVQHYRLDRQALFSGLRLASKRHLPGLIGPACAAAAGVELELRRYEGLAYLGGDFLSATADLSCPLGAGQLGAELRLGSERPAAARPGERTGYAELAVHYRRPLGQGRQLQLDGQLAHAADAAGYSPLMEHHAARRILRAGLGVAFYQPLATGWGLRISLDHQAQTSNLPLFEQNSRVLLLGLHHRWGT